jgi:N6-L-threonylcarbamoyladenine synthase
VNCVALGIDTSNYTTSTALFDAAAGAAVQQKRLLPVKPGELGLRQSDALFHHTVQLPELLEALLRGVPSIGAVGVSNRPRPAQGSYMPCFLAGVAVAGGVAAALGVPLRRFSHQEGHLAAALFSANRQAWGQAPFLAFHLSGGTTECLLVQPEPGDANAFAVEIIGGSSDLKAGQLVDRIGVACGLAFPAGAALDALALEGTLPRQPKPSLCGMQCSFSGLENQCRTLLAQGCPQPDAARFCLESIAAALEAIALQAQAQYGALPLLFAGGVACSRVIRSRLGQRFPKAAFAAPDFSADNAAGVAILAACGAFK